MERHALVVGSLGDEIVGQVLTVGAHIAETVEGDGPLSLSVYMLLTIYKQPARAANQCLQSHNQSRTPLCQQGGAEH